MGYGMPAQNVVFLADILCFLWQSLAIIDVNKR